MSDPFIMVAPNGARRGKDDHRHLPITVAETVQEAKACHTAGASALHLHIRDDDGNHSLDAGRYLEVINELNSHLPNMEVQITTEAVGIYSVSDQLDCIEKVKADWASISVREIARDPILAPKVYATCKELGTRVQHIVYDQEDASLLTEWLANGIIDQSQRSVLMVLGRYSENQTSERSDIEPLLASLPVVDDWMLCAFGPQEHECLVDAVRLGGNCRVGFENSLVNAEGDVWDNNAASVSALVSFLAEGRS